MARSNPHCEGPCNEGVRLNVVERPRRFAFDDEDNLYGIHEAAGGDPYEPTIEAYHTWVEELTNYCTWHFRDHPFILEPINGIYPACMEDISDNFAPIGWGLKCGRMSLLPWGEVTYYIWARPLSRLHEIPRPKTPVLRLRIDTPPLYKD